MQESNKPQTDEQELISVNAEPGGAGESGQPQEPLLARRRVFVLVLVGPGHDKPGKAGRIEGVSQMRDTLGRVGRPALVGEGLEAALGGSRHVASAAVTTRPMNGSSR